MEISECQESVSQETLEKWNNIHQEEQFRHIKLNKTIETINKFVELYFKDDTIFLSKEIIDTHLQLLEDSNQMLKKYVTIIKSQTELLEGEEHPEKVHLLLIESSKNIIEEMKSFQIRADSLVNRCIDYTPQYSAA
ncbi:MAG: hypothetical protein KDK96_05840 [Chlamydiia bacterium]|nr:hypothetical protein [Chlamydiia bacterium]